MQHDKYCSFIHLGVDTLRNKGRCSSAIRMNFRCRYPKKISVDAVI